MLGKYYFLYCLFLSLSFFFFFTDSHVISLTTPETEQVIVCLVFVFMAFLAFNLVAFLFASARLFSMG